MSEYNHIGRPSPKDKQAGKRPEDEKSLRPGTQVRVYTPMRNDPNEHTVYTYEGMVDTPEGQKAKLSFKTTGGKTFVRAVHPDDLISA